MINLFELLAWAGAIVGGLLVLSGFAPGLSAPQSIQLVAAGIGIAFIPYSILAGLRRSEAARLLAQIARQTAATPTPDTGIPAREDDSNLSTGAF